MIDKAKYRLVREMQMTEEEAYHQLRRMAMERGLVDGIGELRTVMRTRYGDKVRLRPIPADRRRLPFLSRLPFVRREPVWLVAELVDWLETRLLWARFGL